VVTHTPFALLLSPFNEKGLVMAQLLSPDMKSQLRSMRDLLFVWPVVVSVLAGFAALMRTMM